MKSSAPSLLPENIVTRTTVLNDGNSYRCWSMLEDIDLPWDWPVDVACRCGLLMWPV